MCGRHIPSLRCQVTASSKVILNGKSTWFAELGIKFKVAFMPLKFFVFISYYTVAITLKNLRKL